ncbi:enoyl-CoA hydratase [Hyphomicrobium sp.]|jgi:enoyl-CoA hydratase/carnithine racemase|uniref:enoyl-CoA hydratase n=1 Tax=Hyphomicrobium sp. TaxID=82 RepID=UPI0035692DF6
MQDLSPAPASLVLADIVEPGIGRLTLNRPEARNALSRAVIHALHAEIERLGADSTVAAIVLAASGKVYSSGHDLKEMTARRSEADGGEGFFRETMGACSAMMRAIVACPKPVIAAVEGRATAAGCQLVATCDLAVASETADFATPGVNIGLFCSTPMVALSRNVPRKRAMEMLLLGEAMSAADALSYGLVNRVVASGEVINEALGMARIIAAKSKSTVAIGKAAFYRQAELSLDDAYAYASEVMVRNMMTADAGEGICAFVEKRHPEWKDK